ncbi:endonuclease III domain-containing protein [Methanobacterium petrolearium]|uniref:endonuclease III domain-containing protein n=1 Tax=Methanobacterium petrolearium TaxID=710190 RepID=UPI001AE5B57C|nr:endonuclease III domain-containing protein [Methanobacterium petrolearium]MBP1945226.1 endonuclease-3 related protein [Methanobacterium petrolearium]BDZ71160.1 endonuclease III domain-containing protein [Methanobacterium petrolearium]
MSEAPILKIYEKLYDLYGPQGWWPLMDLESENLAKTGATHGYHPLNYDLPETENQRYEIILGAILTQNTAWTSAEKALWNLKKLDAISPEKLLNLDEEILKEAVRPAGFLNQKSAYLINITNFFISIDGKTPSRKELLKIKGVGNETADSMLLYAYKQPEFVVDAYTKRIFSHLGVVDEKISYMKLKTSFEENLPKDVPLYQEYHALIVEHAKRYYHRKPFNDIIKV